MRRSWQLAAVVVAGCLACAGAAAGLAGASTASNRRLARADVGPLLARLALPSGAMPAGSDPAANSALNEPAFETATPARTDAHAFWRVPGAPQAVFDWIQAHPPAGSTVFASGIQALRGAAYAWSVTFSFPVKAGLLRSKTLAVGATAAEGGGTALRADAEAVWWVVRPRWERIPRGVHEVTIAVRRLGRPPGTPTAVIGASKVSRIVALVDRLPRAQPGTSSCPADWGRLVDLDFLGAPGAAPVAVATADGSGCGTVSLEIRGRAAPALSGGPGLIKALDSLLGVRF